MRDDRSDLPRRTRNAAPANPPPGRPTVTAEEYKALKRLAGILDHLFPDDTDDPGEPQT